MILASLTDMRAVKRLHADMTTISFYGEYDIDLLSLSQAEQEEILKITRGYNKDGKPQCNQVVVGQIVNEEGLVLPVTSWMATLRI